MKVSALWLHEWINPAISQAELCQRLTMAGLEIESVTPVAQPFSQVVVGEVLTVEKHPEADRLTVCTVNVGQAQPLTIVCGAKNVAAGIKIPAALEGAVLANNLKITTSKLRGVTSQGMLCSAKELGFTEESDGLFILPNTAIPGTSVWDYLQLGDEVIDVSITPNRGDCLSIKGLAREISALTETAVTVLKIPAIQPTISDTLPITLTAPACEHYVGRVIKNVKADAETPLWLKERLRRAGQRCISPVVDVMNYVMFELGQPMHAFDLATITKSIEVRTAKPNEKLALLDGQTVDLKPETLIIADAEKPLAIAGVMGGLDSAVTLLTKDIFLESAYFNPQTVAQAARAYKLISESSSRFERAIDPTIQVEAIERATQLLLEIVGGDVGPVINIETKKPEASVISLRHQRVNQLLGLQITPAEIEALLTRLSFHCEKTADGWRVTVPFARADVQIEVDLIEEIMRLYGSDKIPLRDPVFALSMHSEAENTLSLAIIRNNLRDAGYNEVITYSFVDQKLQTLLDPEKTAKSLMNPITADMNVMRTNLWPGLVKTFMYNLNRQQPRARIFETGLKFILAEKTCLQERVISGLVTGTAFPEQWGIPNRPADFFDIKGDIQNLLKLTRAPSEFIFAQGEHPALHPGQTAVILRNEKPIGIVGALHPSVMQALDLTQAVFVFELSLDAIEAAIPPKAAELSKYPEIRRDLAFFIDRSIPAQLIQDTIVISAGELLKEVVVFDVYQGKGVGVDRKSIALSLTLQHGSRTLVDEEVNNLIERVITELTDKFTAELRG